MHAGLHWTASGQCNNCLLTAAVQLGQETAYCSFSPNSFHHNSSSLKAHNRPIRVPPTGVKYKNKTHQGTFFMHMLHLSLDAHL